MGCFNEHTSKDLPITLIENGQVSVEICREICAQTGFKYAGLSSG